MNKKSLIAAVVITLLFFASARYLVANTANLDNEASSACERAELALQLAVESKMVWTTTEDLLKKAKEAIGNGDFSEAVELCSSAEFQANASIEQAKTEANAWRVRVPK